MQLQLEDDAALWEMGEQAVMMFYVSGNALAAALLRVFWLY